MKTQSSISRSILTSLAMVLVLIVMPRCWGQFTIFVGNQSGSIQLDPNQLTAFDVTVVNNGPDLTTVFGSQLNLQITGSGTPPPIFSHVDLLTGTVFAAGFVEIGGISLTTPTLLEDGTAALGGPVTIPGGGASSKLGTVTFNTAGVSLGTWQLSLTTAGGSTSLLDSGGSGISGATLINGTLAVVPEANAGVVVALGLGVFALLWCRKARALCA